MEQEPFVIGEINQGLYEKFLSKFKKAKDEIVREIEVVSFDSSNLENYIQNSLELFSNINDVWGSSDFNEMQKLQKLLFPEGIWYDRKKDRVRTTRVNSVLELTSNISAIYKDKKEDKR